MSNRTILKSLLLTLSLTGFIQKSAVACEMCKAGIVSGINLEYVLKLSEGYYWSILLMLTVPFILIITVIFLLMKAGRQKN